MGGAVDDCVLLLLLVGDRLFAELLVASTVHGGREV